MSSSPKDSSPIADPAQAAPASPPQNGVVEAEAASDKGERPSPSAGDVPATAQTSDATAAFVDAVAIPVGVATDATGRGRASRRGPRASRAAAASTSPAQDTAGAASTYAAPEVRAQLAESAVAPSPRSLAEILDGLPTSPGVYVMKDRRGKILYIGKAASLRTRVRQYFQPNTGDVRLFVPLLEGLVADIETVLTSNEKEALLLENTLIKKHQPRFNINLRDDKSYLVLRLDPAASWPRLEVVRRLAEDGAYYFGPYHSATSCREALRVVNRHFQLRTCTDHVLANRKRPCLQYQIKRCPAPCVLPVSRDAYGDQVRDVRLFLENKNEELLARLTGRMKEAATRLDFEQAAATRDQIRALETTLEGQRVVSRDFVDQDVVGFHREGLALEIVVMNIRRGSLVGTKAFSYTNQEFPDVELLSTFLGLYYDQATAPPDEVLLPFAIEDADLKADWLSEKRGGRRKVEVLVPQRGDRRRLVELAQKNAAASFASRRNAREDAEIMLAKLQRRLRLSVLPRVIECYDVSHIQGFATVASMVVFVDGKPDKARYRTYNVRSVAARQGSASARQNDDFAAMYEVLSRRFRRAREGDSGWDLPDLLVVDGGKGQLGMALAAARDVGIDVRPGTGLPIVALAKEREAVSAESERAPHAEPVSTEGEAVASIGGGDGNEAAAAGTGPGRAFPDDEPPVDPFVSRRSREADRAPARPDRLFLPYAKDAIPIRANSAEMFVLQQLRDEAHRFAVKTHRLRRKRLTLRSALAEIPGIGEKRQRLLLRHFGSLRKIKDAAVDELAAVPGVGKVAAQAVFAALNPAAVSPTAAREERGPGPGESGGRAHGGQAVAGPRAAAPGDAGARRLSGDIPEDIPEEEGDDTTEAASDEAVESAFAGLTPEEPDAQPPEEDGWGDEEGGWQDGEPEEDEDDAPAAALPSGPPTSRAPGEPP